MISYETAPWHDLFQGVIGAAATLAGLIFVAVSLNHEVIVGHPRLPSLAARSLAVLTGLVFLATFVLAPGQSRTTVGVEIGVLGVSLVAAVVGTCVRSFTPDMQLSWKVRDLATSAIATLPMLVAGVSMGTATGGGLYWAMAESMCGFMAALFYAWILLIEIRR